MPDLPKDFAARVRAAHGYAGVRTRKDFAELVGVAPGTIKNYEIGKHKPEPRAAAETVKRLAAASKLPEWFFTIPRLDSLRLGASKQTTDERLIEIERQLSRLLGAIGVDAEAHSDIADMIVKTVDRAINLRATEVARRPPGHAAGRDHPHEDRRDAA